jgi:hypothetical protein
MQEKDKTCFVKMDPSNSAIATQLHHAISVMSAIDDLTFRKQISGSSVGEQFRHVLDYVDKLLEGAKVGKIDFSNRRRDSRVEKDRAFAIEQFENALDRVKAFSNSSTHKMVSVRSDTDPGAWFVSSLGREIDYVTSHSVHHYALLAEKLNALGISCAETFGVAPSTMKYRESLAA